MKLDTKFNVGQRVWVRRPLAVERVDVILCSACDATGEVTLKDTKIYICPVCKGTKELRNAEWADEARMGTVTGILITTRVQTCTFSEELSKITILYSVPAAMGPAMAMGRRNSKYHSPQYPSTGIPEELIFASRKACLTAIEVDAVKDEPIKKDKNKKKVPKTIGAPKKICKVPKNLKAKNKGKK